MDIYEIIFTFTTQFPSIMAGVKQIVALVGLGIGVLSITTLLKADPHDKAARKLAWGGMFFSSMLISLQKWMNLLTNSLYRDELGPIFLVGSDFERTNNMSMIFEALQVYVIAFGWFALISGTFKFYEAPRYNSPGIRRRATALMVVGVFSANIAITIDIVGNSFGYSDAYQKMKDSLITR